MSINLNELSKEVHENAVNHGFWEENRGFGEVIALIHSELSEALEEHRNGFWPTEIYSVCEKCREHLELNHLDDGMAYWDSEGECCCCNTTHKPEGIPIELADCIIRILDFCGKEKIDIEEAIKIKHEYNKTRPYKHGKKI